MSTENQVDKTTNTTNKKEKDEAYSIISPLDNPDDFIIKHQKKLIILGSVIAIAIAGFFAFNYFKTTQEIEAQSELFQAVYYFEADSLDKALKGDGNRLGLVDVSNDYSMTKAGNLACYYAGVAYLKQGKFDEAIEYLNKFSASDLVLQARAYALTGDAYMEKNDLPKAIEYYTKAAEFKTNKQFTPGYLMKLGLAQELSKDFKGSVATYDKIINDFPTSDVIVEAKKYKGLNEGRLD